MGFTIPAVQPRLLMEGHLPAVEATTPTVRKTALNPVHRRMGAKMVEFNGWDMPVEYPSAGRSLTRAKPVPTRFGVLHVVHFGGILLPRAHPPGPVPAISLEPAFRPGLGAV